MRYFWRSLLLTGICIASACSDATPASRTRDAPGKPSIARLAAYSARSIVPSGATGPAPLAPGRIASIYGEHLVLRHPAAVPPIHCGVRFLTRCGPTKR